MDLFNKKKIEQLERDVEHWKREYDSVSRSLNNKLKEIETLNEKIQRLKIVVRGERICDGYCLNCKNCVSRESYVIMWNGAQETTLLSCALDCRCKDFQKAE